MQPGLQGYKIAGLIGIGITFVISYFLLFGPDKTIFSISTWICQQVKPDEEVAIMLALPAYLASVVFGGGFLGWSLGSKVYQIIHHH